MFKTNHSYTLFFLVLCVALCTSCERQIKAREYEEIVTSQASDPHEFMNSVPLSMQLPVGQDNRQMQDILDASVARPSLSWKTPQGWTEEKGGGMRIVTFRSTSSDIECSIVSLGGQAGGLESNVTRWIGQINVSIPSGDQLSEFLDRQRSVKTEGDFSMTVIDLTEFSQNGEDPSMIAAIAELKDKAIFVKMTGTKDHVAANRDHFKALCKSLNIN